jgi:hypothetical protein
VTDLQALAAKLTEQSPTRTAGFEAYGASHQGAALRHLAGSVDRRLREVAAATGAHLTEVLRLHAHFCGKVLAAEAGVLPRFHVAGRDIVESYVARVMAERAGLLEARPATLARAA